MLVVNRFEKRIAYYFFNVHESTNMNTNMNLIKKQFWLKEPLYWIYS